MALIVCVRNIYVSLTFIWKWETWGETIDEDADADDISCRLFYSSCTATIPAPEDAGRWRCCYWLQQTNTASHRKQPLKDGVEIWLLLRIFM